MPGMNGIETLEKIRSLNRRVAVIMIKLRLLQRDCRTLQMLRTGQGLSSVIQGSNNK